MGETKKRKSGMVRVRGGFSDVQGIAPCNTEIQMEEFDDVTRNMLCNILYNVLEVIFNDPNEVVDKPVNRDDFQLSFCKSIIGNVFCETYSQGIPAYCTWRDIYSRIQSVILESEYNEVLDVMVELAQGGMTMMVITHEMNFARRVSDRVIFMADGQILEEAPPDEFFDNPKTDRAKDFLESIKGH